MSSGIFPKRVGGHPFKWELVGADAEEQAWISMISSITGSSGAQKSEMTLQSEGSTDVLVQNEKVQDLLLAEM